MGKGSNAERELARIGWEKYGWATLRAPGSGSIDRPSPDVIFINAQYDRDYGIYEKKQHTEIIAVELKNHPNGTATFKEQEIEELIEWSNRAGAKPYVGIKPDLRKHDQWYFEKPKNLTVSYGFTQAMQEHADSIEDLFA